MYQDKYEEALKYDLDAIKYIERTNDLLALSLSHSNVAVIFSRQHLFENEMLYCNKALGTAMILKDGNTIGVCYTNLAQAYMHGKDTVKSYEASLNALAYLRESPFKLQIAAAFQNVSSGLLNRKEYAPAMDYCDSSLQLYSSFGSNQDIAGGLILKSIIALAQKRVNTAMQVIHNAKKYVEDDGSWILLREWNLQKATLK